MQLHNYYTLCKSNNRKFCKNWALPEAIREARRLDSIITDERKPDQIVVAAGDRRRRRRSIGAQQPEPQKSPGGEAKSTRRRSGSSETRTTPFGAAAPELARTVIAQLLRNTAPSHHHCPSHLDWQQQLPAAILPSNGEKFKEKLLCANAQSRSSMDSSCGKWVCDRSCRLFGWPL